MNVPKSASSCQNLTRQIRYLYWGRIQSACDSICPLQVKIRLICLTKSSIYGLQPCTLLSVKLQFSESYNSQKLTWLLNLLFHKMYILIHYLYVSNLTDFVTILARSGVLLEAWSVCLLNFSSAWMVELGTHSSCYSNLVKFSLVSSQFLGRCTQQCLQ